MSADNTTNQCQYPLGIDIGSTTVKIAIINEQHELLFSDYERHFADIQNTLAKLLDKAYQKLGEIQVSPVITGSGALPWPTTWRFPLSRRLSPYLHLFRKWLPRQT